MPRLNTFKLKIKTGERGFTGQAPEFKMNGHRMPLGNFEGSAAPGGECSGGFQPYSFAHSLTLVGPTSGEWDIERIDVSYEVANEPPYSAIFGKVTLDPDTELNLWQEPPLPTFDV